METGVGGLIPTRESTVMDPYEQLVEELVPAEKDDGLLLEAEQVIPKVEQERTIGTTGEDVVPATGSEVGLETDGKKHINTHSGEILTASSCNLPNLVCLMNRGK